MRGLIAVAVWLSLSVPLALVVARILRAAGAADDVAAQAERWLRRASTSRSERARTVAIRSVVAGGLLAPLLVVGAIAAWRLPAAVTITRADGQLALAWPPGQEDATTTTSVADDAGAAPVEQAATGGSGGGGTAGGGGDGATTGRAGAAAPPPGTDATPEPTTPEPTSPEPAGEPVPPTGPAPATEPEPEPEPDRHCPTLRRGDGPPRCQPDGEGDGDDEGDGTEEDGGESSDTASSTSTTSTTQPPSTTSTTTPTAGSTASSSSDARPGLHG